MKFDVIDKTAELAAIKREYGPDYYKNKEAQQAASDLWGAPCNDSGVFENVDTDIVYEKGLYRAEIHLTRTLKEYWLMGLSASTPLEGFGHYPSVWDRYGYSSRKDAKYQGLNLLCEYFSKVGEKSSSLSMLTEFKKVIFHLYSEKTPQLNLFDRGAKP